MFLLANIGQKIQIIIYIIIWFWKIPIIGDIVYALSLSLIPPLVFFVICALFIKNSDNIDFSNNYDLNPWLFLTININNICIRHSFKEEDDEGIYLIIILWLVGAIPAFIAYSKGRSLFNWWMYGHLLFIFALPHALLLKETELSLINKGIYKKCPYCAEIVKSEAKVCKHCGNKLNQ